MTLRIHNTLTRALEDFSPLEPGHVRMYVCGMTVYDLCHLGHARSMVAFDVVQRWLKASGFRVTYVRNVTDIDDKIIKRSLENRESIRSLTDRMVDALHQDADALGIERPTFEPRATEFVPQMLQLISKLSDKGLAYQSLNGDVNYAVRKFPGYGKLSGKSLDDLRAGERVEVNSTKRDPLDFVLWKRAKPGEPSWPSPWGPGRPGWHLIQRILAYFNIIWDEADEVVRLARISHPRISIDTSGLNPKATELANRLADDVAKLDAAKSTAESNSFTLGLKLTDRDFVSLDEANAVIALGGDVPPELSATELSRIQVDALRARNDARSAALAYADQSIRINTICPGEIGRAHV